MAEKLRDVAMRFWTAISTGDMDTVSSMLHPDLLIEQMPVQPYGGTYKGPAGFQALMPKFGSAWNFEVFELDNLFESADGVNVVVKLRVAGTVVATGEKFETPVLEQWGFKDGKWIYALPCWFKPPMATKRV